MKRNLLLRLGCLILITLWFHPVPAKHMEAEAGRSVRVLVDSDGDGVDDSVDLCPNTPAGVGVNAYGCPVSTTVCDYTTSTVTFTSTSATNSGAGTVRYVLASAGGTIMQIASTPSFTGLQGSQTYMALSVIYDGTAGNLSVGQSLSAVTATCFDWSDALVFRACISQPPQPVADTDNDGVTDTNDLCPNTPAGVAVNAYGCPVDLSTCDYSTTSLTLNVTGGTTQSGASTAYVLASNAGTILQVNSVPVFNGLSGTATYMALAITYSGTTANLTPGAGLSMVTADCLDWSDALMIKVCVAPASTCDYQIGQTIVLTANSGTTGSGLLTRYVLTSQSGVILQVAATPSFPTQNLTEGTYIAYAVIFNDDGSIQKLSADGTNRISAVTASCLAVSPGLSVKVCADCKPVCIPIVAQKIK